MKVTMRDVALEAGVDVSTVSLALRNDPRLRPATRRRIRPCAETLGYRTDPMISTLMRNRRTRAEAKYGETVAFLHVLPFAELKEMPHIWPVLVALRRQAHAAGWRVDSFQWPETRQGRDRLKLVLKARGI